MSGPTVYRLVVENAAGGMRLDQYLAHVATDFSRTGARRVIDLGGVHLNGRRMRRSSHAVHCGDRLEVYLDDRQKEDFSLDERHILFHDAHLLVVNKPSGVNTQPTPARYKGTLYDAVLRLLGAFGRPGCKPSVGMVQRLDRDTSGIIVFSIHPRAHKGLSEAFGARQVQKTYLAMVSGNMAMAQGEFHSQLARQRRTNRMKTVARGGKDALTRYRVVERFAGADLVEVEIPTGRSHQIRAHFSEAGHPLLGDVKYGGPDVWRAGAVPRQMLHAWKLHLKHPVNGQDLPFEAPLPDDLSRQLEVGRTA